MSEHHKQLESRLQALTEWQGEEHAAWEAALAETKAAGRASPLWSFVRSRNGMVAALLVLACSAVLVAFLSPSLQGVRSPMRTADLAVRDESNSYSAWPESLATDALAADPDPYSLPEPARPAETLTRVQDTSPSVTIDRHVIRNATIELLTDDVRAAFLKASHLLRNADGEFVQESSLTGSGAEGDPVQGNLTLRVSANRLSDVLNELRALGTVASEKVTGQDVTAQAVDLEARLRNEQRVEAELLELLAGREDAPLKEVMELRAHLTQVRQEIERLTAQRDRLAGLVSMATVLVIIREVDAPPDGPAAQSIWDHFRGAIAGAWDDGLRILADTIATIVHILIAGIIWWALLAFVASAYLRHRRSRLAEAA